MRCSPADVVQASQDLPSDPPNAWGNIYLPASLTAYGVGLAERGSRDPYQRYTQESVLNEAVKEHQALFLFFHKISVKLWLSSLDFRNIANIVAYAEMYDLLPYVAENIATYLLARDDIWSDVRNNPAFHLAIAKKIRSAPLFLDALRHFIGAGIDWNILHKDIGYTEAEAALLVLPKREQLAGSTADLTKKLQRLGLTPYIAHSNSKNPWAEVGSTFLASGFHRKSAIEKANYLARCIWNEWLNQHLAGDDHWSHVRKSTNYLLPDFMPPGLRLLCNAITEACRNECELNLFDEDAPAKYASIYLGDDNYREMKTQISDALRLLVRTA